MSLCCAHTGIKSWRFTEGGTDARTTARGGSGGGVGYNFTSQPHVCFCEGSPCKHSAFTGSPTAHRVHASTQQKADRAQATDFFSSIKEGTPLASAGDLDDSTAGNEPLWLSIAQGKKVVNEETFTAAGGSSEVRVKVLTLTLTPILTPTW